MPVTILDAPVVTPVGLPTNITVTAGVNNTNRWLIVVVSGDQSTDAIGPTLMTYGGVAMTLLAEADAAATTVVSQIWGLNDVGIASATDTVLASSGAVVDGATAIHLSIKDADQNVPTNTIGVMQTGTSGAASLTRVADSFTLAAHVHGALELSAIANPAQTDSSTVSASSLSFGAEADSNRVVDVSWTNAFDRSHGIVAVNFSPVGGGGDTQPPTITLLGQSTLSIESGTASAYVDAGANSIDNVDPTEVLAPDNLPTDYIGTHLLNFNDSDVAGNTALQVQRTVNVTVPTGRQYVTLATIPGTLSDTNLLKDYTGPSPVVTGQLEAPSQTDQGLDFTLLDNGEVEYDSVPTEDQTITGFLYINPAGERGPAANFDYQLSTSDTTAPVITLTGNATINLVQGDTYVELGATATDDIDGDVTGNIVIDSSAVNTTAVGSYQVTYNVSDTAGNAATQAVRTVNISTTPDTTEPVITLTGSVTINLVQGDAYIELGATATDDIDGDVTGNIVIDSSAVNTTAVGSYQVTYNVSDTAGNAATQVVRTINVSAASDTTLPVITLNGGATINLVQGDTYIELGATAIDDTDGDITSGIVTNSVAVNTAVVGSYPVTYDVSDAAGNAAIQAIRTVNVITAPADPGMGFSRSGKTGCYRQIEGSWTRTDC